MNKRKRPLAVNRQTVKKLTGHEMDKAAGALLSGGGRACNGGGNETGAGISDTTVAAEPDGAVVVYQGVQYRVVSGHYVRVNVIALPRP